MSNFKINHLSFSGTETLYLGGPGLGWEAYTDPLGNSIDIDIPLNQGADAPMARILRFTANQSVIAAELYCYVQFWHDSTTKENIYDLVLTNLHNGNQHHRTFHQDSGTVSLSLQLSDGGLIVVGAIEIDPILPPGTSIK